MTTDAWDSDELERIGDATELELAARRDDGGLRPYVTIWAVRVGDDIYVRAAHGPTTRWYRYATASGRGRIRAGGVERDVTFEPAAAGAVAGVTARYHGKYDHYGDAYVGPVVSPASEQLTLRLVAA